ncbi:transporter substrate-binding domain-containing protein [Oceanicoccus sagamiensis]|nr:transporter substrate-binding domain-containing protein [Oceanicoccus sagamiensis]
MPKQLFPIVIFSLLASLNGPVRGDSLTVTTVPARAGQEASHDYFVSLLKLAFSKTADNKPPVSIAYSKSYSQNGYLLELMREGSRLDILWSGSSQSREKNLLTIKIPLVKGLLGYRMPIIRQEQREQFAAIRTLEQLQSLTACQGMYWPDADILETNGIAVKRLKNNEQMFSELKRGSCDYISLAVFEGQAEIDARSKNYPDLLFFQDLIIYYPYPMYFFVPKSKPALYERVERGLQLAIADGSFDKLMREHASTQSIYPLSRWKNTTTIPLNNQSLQLKPRDLSPQLWILPDQ